MNAQTKRPHSSDIWDPVETWSRDQIEDFQLTALKRQLARVEERSAYYRKVFEQAGFSAAGLKSVEDLRRLPITRKSDYVTGLQEDPPFGTMRAVNLDEAVRVHFSSGTTGRPSPVLWTKRDVERWADLYARYLYAQGLRAGDVFQCMFNYSWFVGGLGATLAAQHIGALVIPGGSVDTKRQIETIREYGTKAVIGTPSFMAHVAEAAEEMGVDLAASTVSMVCVGGEPGASIPGTRERLERMWGAKMFDCYGALECQPIGWDSALQLGPQIAEDFIYVEILDPDTLEPVEDGQRGVLVLTHLDKEACPLVRWWTGDVVVRDRRPTPDGRTHATLKGGVLGRADDMLIVRGVNLFPSAVEDIVRAFPGTTNEYVLVLDDSVKDPKSGFLTGVKLRVERTEDAPADLGEQLSHRLRERLQVRFVVEVLPAGSLPRTVHKAKRVITE
ncbi:MULTISPECIES: phenylacetate--CoA ligase family protein [Microvirga]|uniref:phenylacetate--CoA ligase family protein n=1 Tax=Microvirga TaxID=186650 RepID=UPI001CFE7A3D|nr:AMP-binding protein [Microvirga lenta]MCB5174618.1 AMP-binding protein [Microvirga lenta]